MSITEQYKSEHKEILAVVSELFLALDIDSLKSNANNASQLLFELNSLLIAHLTMEDTHIYPAFMTSESSDTREVGQMLKNEFGDLLGLYKTLSSDWDTVAKIERDAEKFEDDATIFLALLTQRIHREDKLMLPLISRTIAAANSSN